MKQWAPLIYGRTKHVDFRFLALPSDFSKSDRLWSEHHILATLRRPEDLAAGLRWVRFCDGRHLVVGIGCMAHDLVDEAPDSQSDYTHDITGRAIYLFLGYAVQLEDANFDLPAYGELAIFRTLYALVRARWEDRSYDRDIDLSRPYDIVLPTSSPSSALASSLNTDPNKLLIWPASAGRDLWSQSPGEVTSLCLCLKAERDGLESPFMNVTLRESETRVLVERPQVVRTEPEVSPEASAAAPTSGLRDLLRPTPVRVVGGAVGAGVGFIVGGGPNPIGVTLGIVGFGAGWTTVGLAETYIAAQQSRVSEPRAAVDYGITERRAPTSSPSDGEQRPDNGTDWFSS